MLLSNLLIKCYKKLLYKTIKVYRFGFSISINGDPRRISIGKGTYISKGAVFEIQGGKIEIGNNCEIGYGVILNTSGGQIFIGNESSLNPYCIVYGDGNLIIGNHVRIAAHSIIVPANHNYLDKNTLIVRQGFTKKGITIKDDVWIGAGVKILDGVVINTGAVIAAGSVVNSSIPEYALCAGTPARVIKFRT